MRGKEENNSTHLNDQTDDGREAGTISGNYVISRAAIRLGTQKDEEMEQFLSAGTAVRLPDSHVVSRLSAEYAPLYLAVPASEPL